MPYAVRTLLGWGIIGPITPLQEEQEGEEDAKVTACHRITSRKISSDIPASLSFVPQVQSKEEISPNTVNKMFEMDFSERNSAQEALLQEDRSSWPSLKAGPVNVKTATTRCPCL